MGTEYQTWLQCLGGMELWPSSESGTSQQLTPSDYPANCVVRFTGQSHDRHVLAMRRQMKSHLTLIIKTHIWSVLFYVWPYANLQNPEITYWVSDQLPSVCRWPWRFTGNTMGFSLHVSACLSPPQTCTCKHAICMVRSCDWMQRAGDAWWMLMRLFGCFLERWGKRRSSIKLPLCLQDREEGWGEQIFPHYLSKSNPIPARQHKCVQQHSLVETCCPGWISSFLNHIIFFVVTLSRANTQSSTCPESSPHCTKPSRTLCMYVHTNLLCSQSVPVFMSGQANEVKN